MASEAAAISRSDVMVATDLIHSASASLIASSVESSGGGISVDFDKSVLIQFVAFLLLLVLIKPLLIDPFLKLMEEREKRTEGARAAARTMDARAGEILQKYEAELDKVRKVAAEERERLRIEGQRLEQRMLEEARVEAARITAEGKQAIAREAEALRADLAKATGSLADDIASRVMGRGL